MIITTAGNVDDGKSTLTGRLIYDCQSVFSDQVQAVTHENSNTLNLAHFTDGLKREQAEGITIDVAHRYFQSSKKRFTLRDAPGHFQFTRNVVTAASTAEVMVLVVDASRHLSLQTTNHLLIAITFDLLIIVCLHKMDLVSWDEKVFRKKRDQISEIAAQNAILAKKENPHLIFIPTSAVTGENIVKSPISKTWYEGATLLQALEAIDASVGVGNNIRLPVQLSHNDGSISGELIQGQIKMNDVVTIWPRGTQAKIKKIRVHGQERSQADAKLPIRIDFEDPQNCQRGDLIATPESVIPKSEVMATVFWLHPSHHSHYIVRHTTNSITGYFQGPIQIYDIETMGLKKKEFFETNDIGIAKIRFSEALPFDSYDTCKETGSFILIDPLNNEIAGAGIYR